MIIDFLAANNNFGINIKISDERKLLLDTGGGLKKASDFFMDGNPFLLFNSDIICDTNLKAVYNLHVKSKTIATLLVRKRKSSRYLLFDDLNNLCGWENVKTGEKIITRQSSNLKRFSFSGVHIINPKIFKYFPVEDKFSIIDFYLQVSKKENIKYFNHTRDSWFDVGSEEKLREAEEYFKTAKF